MKNKCKNAALATLTCLNKLKIMFDTIFSWMDTLVHRSYKIMLAFLFMMLFYVFWLIFIDTTFPITKFVISSYQLKYKENSAYIVLREKVCSTKNLEIRVDSRFTDHMIYNTPSQVYYINSGCQTFVTSIYVPLTLNPDTYEYSVTITAAVNVLKTMSMTIPLVDVNVSTGKINKISVEKIGRSTFLRDNHYTLYPSIDKD